MAVVSLSPIAPPPGLARPPPGLERPGAAPVSVPRCCLHLDALLSEPAGSSGSTSVRGTQPKDLPSSRGHGLPWGSPRWLAQDSASSLPVASDEPAYIRLGECLSPVNTSVGDALSETSLSSHSERSVLEDPWRHSQDPAGSRRVQDALDEASDETREVALQEFHGRAVKAMRDPHANHVLQKCIRTLPAESLQFMIDELLEREGLAASIAKHRYGGRIVQQLLKKCDAAQVGGIAEALMHDAVTLACATFGTYSMQHLLQFGTDEQVHRLAEMVAENVATVGRSSAGSGVVAAAMEHAAAEDKVLIARAALQEPGLLGLLAQGRHSYRAVPQMLEVLDEVERLQAHGSLAQDLPALRAARYGRTVAKYLDAEMSPGARSIALAELLEQNSD
mmetsp:Transcript_80159/g.202763  ORF Transcript_80159/g.202763 Transcript_80159/m.202763 type:complete len:392 (-) Transcript_80159:254-1429(-)